MKLIGNSSKIITNEKLIRIFVFLAMITSSFDIFLNLNIAGYTFRFTQFIIMPVLGIWIGACLRKGRIFLPFGGKELFLWFLIQSLFIIRSPNLNNAVQVSMYFLFDIITVFAITFFCNRAYSFEWLFSMYINSFVFIAVFGLLQFFLFPLGINLLVRQYWFSKLARINAFSYEPSYFAMYMLIGFIIFAYLVENKYAKDKYIKIKFFIITLVMLLSTSRIGWLMMVLWIGLRILVYFRKIYYGESKKNFFGAICVISILIIILIYIAIYLSKNTIWLQGMGILGTSNHSSSDRIRRLKVCLAIWRDSPLFGYSMGGVDPMICKYWNIPYVTGANGAASSIIGEVLVAGGIIGTIPFVLFFGKLVFPVKYNVDSKNERSELYALIWALVFELIAFCMNQNTLRSYFWLHIAVLCSCYKNLYLYQNTV